MSNTAQAIIDQTEIEIAEGKQTSKKGLALIEKDEELKLQKIKNQQIVSNKWLDGEEYNIDSITIKIKTMLESLAYGFVKIGNLLMAVKEMEGHGNFIKWIENNMPFSPRAAQKYMQIAIAIKQRPELAPFTKGGVYKSLALLDLPDEYQDEFANEGTIKGNDIDKYLTMTHKELREEIKKMKKDSNRVVSEETKALEAEKTQLVAENKKLRKELDAMQIEDQSFSDPEWIEEELNIIQEHVSQIVSICGKIFPNENIKGDLHTQAKLEGLITLSRRALGDLNSRWYEYFDPDEEFE